MTPFSEQDRRFMQIALQEAKTSFDEGNYPVGAVLTANGKLVATGRNQLFTTGRIADHAESSLLVTHSAKIRDLWKAEKHLTLYTTLEPCLMCLATSLFHRIHTIIIACPDPHGGTTHLDPAPLGNYYVQNFPDCRMGLLRDESYALLIEFIRSEKMVSWRSMLTAFENMHQQ